MVSPLSILYLIFDGVILVFFILWQKISNKSFVILCDKYGNIGNQLYMSCFMIKLAEEFGALTFNFGLIHNQQYFPKPSTDIFLRYPYAKSFNSPKLQEILASSLNRISLRLLNFKLWKNIKSLDLLQNKTEKDFHEFEATIQNSDITFLRGFIHNQPYSIFRKVFSIINEYFEVSSRFHSKINEPLEKLKDCDLIVGVAIRHGDYKTWQNGKYYLTTQTYQKWMEKVESFFAKKSVGFFIASDEEQELSIFEKHNFFFRPGHPLENLYSLSKCDYLLSVPSSFAGWAHFIGETGLLSLDKNVRQLSREDFKHW
jgi:hypothetical protein